MVDFEHFKTFLPRYLSDDSLEQLFEDIKKFVFEGVNHEIYTCNLQKVNSIFQGDALNEMPFMTFPIDKEPANCKVLVLSNTCDINPDNTRSFTSHILYAPIFRLTAYEEKLLNSGINKEKLINHIADIRNQVITQIIFLPAHKFGPDQDCIVFLDRICHCESSYIDPDSLKERRLFSFSDFGFYLFLLKLSVHFTRLREKVDRYKGQVL